MYILFFCKRGTESRAVWNEKLRSVGEHETW